MDKYKIHNNELYALEMYGGNAGSQTVFCDLIVMDTINTIYAANIIQTDTKVKSAAALLQDGKTGQLRRAEGASRADGHVARSIYSLGPKKNMYDEESVRVDDLNQTLLVSKTAKPDLKARNAWQAENIRRLSEGAEPLRLPDSLQELILAWDGEIENQLYEVLDDRYNTPMLPEWKEYVIEALVERELFIPLFVYTFANENTLKAGLLKVTESDLERIISEGIKSYELEFAIEEDGRSEDEGILNDCKSIDQYLNHFAGELGARIQENITLRFNPDTETHHPAFYDVNLQANENGLTGLYPPQANTIMGVSRTLLEDDFCFIIGEMGSGKTNMGLITPYITEAMLQKKDNDPKPKRVIVMSPAIMVEKWAREIKERIPNCKTFQITHWKDVLEIEKANKIVNSKGKVTFKEPETWEYYIMSSESPKFTFPVEAIKDWRTNKSDIPNDSVLDMEPEDVRHVTRVSKNEDAYTLTKEAVVKRDIRHRFFKDEVFNVTAGRDVEVYSSGSTGFYCPKCGGRLMQRGDEPAGEHFFDKYTKSSGNWTKNVTRENSICVNEVETAKLPKEEIREWKYDRTSGRYVPASPIQRCGFNLWQPEKLPLESGYRKVSPAWYINKKLPRGFFKYLLADEVHEYKSGSSSLGQAFGQLVNHTEKQILLTGTLMGGMSRDIFYLLARLSPKGLLREGLGYKDEAAFNSRYGISEHNTRSNGGQLRKSSIQKPGISPHLFPMHLMSNCAFLELNDMGYALPPYEEVPVIVRMDERHYSAYKDIAHQIMSTMRSVEGLGGMSSISTYMNALYQYADAPFDVNEIVAYDPFGERHVLGEPQNFDKDEFMPAKLQQLIDTVDEQIYQHGRKNLIYVKYTGKEAWNQMDTYLYDKFKSLGYNVGILRNGGSYDGIKMPKNSRQREEWLNGMMEKHDWDIVITNPRLVKVGLDLLSFPNIHFFQLDYSTYDYMQASRRSWRLKQTQDVKVFTYVYQGTIQEKGLQHIAKKIDAAMAMQGKFSEEGLRAMADSGDGMNALAKQLMNDDVLEDLETVHDIFARKNQSFEEMQSVEFQDYDGYIMNPIEGGIETVRKIAEGIISRIEEEAEAGRVTKEEVRRAKKAFVNYMDMFEEVVKTVEDLKAVNKGVSKKNKAIEGQQELDLFAFI